MDQLTNEINKVNLNQSLDEAKKKEIIIEKYEILLQPIISVIEHVNEVTTQLQPETPNEELFQQEFGRKIVEALYVPLLILIF